ncbi:hypothetical protein [Caballeronia sp. GAFFF1]|uniref:hypothetical protein n=1 Tax=Caballeronia sp. GAFFF1 TaxID=2921779 RepID=UPI002027EA20|nr:hypothetical protein [Caballeronia sp. GAFFF1]
MTLPTSQDVLMSAHNKAEYFYLLVDPLAGCDDYTPVAPENLAAKFGDSALTIVPRADLAHDEDACPRLVTLSEPGASPDAALLDASARYALRDAGYDKRYLCAWLSSAEPPYAVASGIADRCIVKADNVERFVPFFEPVRMELLLATSIEDANLYRGPISDWLYPDANGHITRLRQAKTHADRISDKSLSVQAGAPWVARLLSAWRNTIRSEELTYAPARWQGPTLLPPDATIQAYRQLRDASDMGLTSLEDQLVFSLHRLYMHPRLETHPQVRAAIARAAAGETSLAAQFDNYSDAMWAQIVATLP